MIVRESYCGRDMLVALLLCWWGLCYGFVLPAAAGGGNSRMLEPATVFTYGYESTILLNQVEPGGGKDVGFQLTGQLLIETIWQSSLKPQDKLLQIKVRVLLYFGADLTT